MAGFGGSVKLTGESEYRRAIQQITQDLGKMSGALKTQAAEFSAAGGGMKNAEQRQNELNAAIKEQQTELNKAKTALASYSVALQAQQQRHNALTREYKAAITELDKIGKESGETSEAYKKQAEVVDKLGQELADSTASMNESKSAMSQLKSKINEASRTIDDATREMDELGKETEESGKQAEKAGNGGFTIMKGVIADLAASAIKAAVNGLKKLGSALINIGKQSYGLYAEYEQLVGGVETLFGESSDQLLEYAKNAYKTAGLSANEYMEQATSFSATLLQGLGGDTKKAVQYANMAISDMSDNANKMGTDMYMIQNAYQGFAKDNYTMLDNLKLGYGGTQAEMARLINDSGVLGKEIEVTAQTVKDVPFDKIIEAIHKTQQEIGITGTTMKEAEGTIEGSTKSVKASWDNLLVGIADGNADLSGLIQIFVDNVVTMASNAVPRIKQIVSGLKTAIKSILKQFMPEVANTVLPVIDKIYNALKTIVTFIVKNFSTIAPIVLSAAAAFAALNATMAIAGTIRAVTTALSGLTAGVGFATKAQAVWNAVMNANPIMAVVTAIGLLVGAVLVLSTTLKSDMQKAHEQTMRDLDDLKESIDAETQSYKDLQKAQQEQINAQMSEQSRYEDLYDDLMNIVDANGKVKDGYEKRASFITGQLSEAYGIEIQMIDGVIQDYDELKNTIDEVMEKKKAQIILDSQESMYKEAITKQTEALKKLNTVSEIYNNAKAEMANLDAQYAEAKKGIIEAQTPMEREYYARQLADISSLMNAKQGELTDAEKRYNEQKNLLAGYAYDIGVYEQNMALAHAGEYDKMTTVTWDYVSQFEKAGNAEIAMIEDQIKTTETNLELLREMKQKSGSDIYDDQIKAAEKQLAQLKTDLGKYRAVTKEGVDGVEFEWSDGLDDTLSQITGRTVEFRDKGEDQVQMYIDGVAYGKPKSKKEMAGIVTDTIAEITKKKPDAKTAGENLIDGVNNGISNQNKQSGVFSSIATFGKSLLSKLKSSLKENSPSKATDEMGQFLIEGLPIGMRKKEGKALQEVGAFGRNVLTTLNSELTSGTNLADIDLAANVRAAREIGSVDAGGGYRQYDSMVSAFKDALSEMKIELDDEVAGHFVERTVTRIVYA